MDDDLHHLLRHARDGFLGIPPAKLSVPVIRRHLALDADPEAFEDCDRCELAFELVQAVVTLARGNPPEDAVGRHLIAARWKPMTEDLTLALATIAKLGAPGSELDLIHESEGVDAYREWKGELGMLAADCRALQRERVGTDPSKAC